MGLYLYPLPDQYINVNDGIRWQNGKTYPGHGGGKLDFACSKGTKVKAMTSGEVIHAGQDNSSPHYTSIWVKVTDSAYKQPSQGYFIIRYYHIGNLNVGVGDYVKQGDIIATTGDGICNDHLHIDFSLDGSANNYYGPTRTTLTEDQATAYAIWTSQSGGNDYKGRCWEVFGTKAKYIQKSSSNGQINNDNIMNVTNKFTNDSDWNALYGMIMYEESKLAQDFNNDISKGIIEWVIRVFRNRLFSGSSIGGICQWNSGKPGRSTAEQLGLSCPEDVKQFAKNIMSGGNYFYAEQLADRYPFSDPPVTVGSQKWYDKLYSADTFSGGLHDRGFQTLAQIPFNGGPYFFMEGLYSGQVLSKFWNGNAAGESNYPSPYQH